MEKRGGEPGGQGVGVCLDVCSGSERWREGVFRKLFTGGWRNVHEFDTFYCTFSIILRNSRKKNNEAKNKY